MAAAGIRRSDGPSATPIGMALVGVRVDEPGAGPSSGAGSAGVAAGRRSGYLLPFEIVSVHLLVVLVGAAYLARAQAAPGRRGRSRWPATWGRARRESGLLRPLRTTMMSVAGTTAGIGLFATGLFDAPVGVTHYLVVGAILFTAGVVCMAVKRNALGVLMGIELVLNGANVNFVAFDPPISGATVRRRSASTDR